MLSGIKSNIRQTTINFREDADIQLVLTKQNFTFLEEVTCIVRRDKLENALIKSLFMTHSIEL